MSLDLVQIRRDLHRHPELGFQEERTAKTVMAHLIDMGLTPQRYAGTGVVADIDSGRPGPLIALRADMDALPIQETTGLPYASQVQGVSHACGHDVHTTVLLGAAELLCTEKDRWRGRVRLLFQPAEESIGAASLLVEQGALTGVQAIFGLHNEPALAAGHIAVDAGPNMAAADRFSIMVTGKGGHAASPHLTNDPVVAAAAVVLALQTAVSRVTSPLQPLVVSVTQCHAGTAFNVIPDKAELNGTVRYFDRELGESLPALLEQIATGVAAANRCSAQVEYERKVPAVVNDARLAELVRQVGVNTLGADQVHPAPLIMGSEDFSIYQQVVPGCFFRLGSGGPYGWHHPAFTIDEKCLPVGARLLTSVAQTATRQL